MKFLILLLLMIAPSFSFAYTTTGTKDIAFGLNRAAPEMMQKHQLGTKLVYENVHYKQLVYNRSFYSSGATGTYNLLDPVTRVAFTLPTGAIVTDCLIDVVTTPTGSGTIALGTGQATNDLKGATAIGSYANLVACVPVGTAATSIKMTADSVPTATIASGPVTGGIVNVYIQYVVPQ